MILDKLVRWNKSEDADESNPEACWEKEHCRHWGLASRWKVLPKMKVAELGQRRAGGKQHNGSLGSREGRGKAGDENLLNGVYV